MGQYTPKERDEIVQLYIQNNFSIVLTQRAFCEKNKVKTAPAKNTIKSLYVKFVNTGNLSNASHATRQRTKRSDKIIESVRASIEETPTKSSYRRSQELGIARTTLRRIIRSDLKMFPYKIEMTIKEDKTSDGNADREKVNENESDETKCFQNSSERI